MGCITCHTCGTCGNFTVCYNCDTPVQSRMPWERKRLNDPVQRGRLVFDEVVTSLVEGLVNDSSGKEAE
jgi:hypothetical protein